MRNGFKVIDADAHFIEPADIWDRYIEPEYYDRRPRVARVLGKELFEYEDGETQPMARASVAFDQMESKFGHAYRDNWSMESRLKDMDKEGWDIQVCLPTNGFKAGGFSAAIVEWDAGMSAAMCRAYNNWAHEFASVAPGRVKFTAVVPGPSVEEMVVETRRAVEGMGAVSIILPMAIPDKMWHHSSYDPLWSLAQQLDIPLSIHGIASGQPDCNARYDPISYRGVGSLIALHQAMSFPFENMVSLGHFIYTGILDKYPDLKLLILESNAGWVPFWLDRLENYSSERQAVVFDQEPLKLTPQEYFKRNCAVAADADEHSLRYVIDYIGDENLVFNTDYPHPDAPATSAPLRDMMAQPISEESKRKILWDNSVKIYGERLVREHSLVNS